MTIHPSDLDGPRGFDPNYDCRQCGAHLDDCTCGGEPSEPDDIDTDLPSVFDRPKLWAINARRMVASSGYVGYRDLPTFYLDANVSGIITRDHAVRIAGDILNASNDSHVIDAIKLY